MSGLEVVDESTFTVTLDGPFAQFPVTVGYNAFYPLPESFFEDPDAAGKLPVGNGPFKADEEFVPGQGFTLTRYEDYGGEEAAKADVGRLQGLHGHQHRLHRHPGRQPRRPEQHPAGRHQHGRGRVR